MGRLSTTAGDGPWPHSFLPSLGPWLVELRATFRLALPLVLLQVGQMAIATTDVLMIGRLGADALAAATLGSSLYFAVWLFGMAIASAAAPLAAQALGAGDRRGVRRTVRQAIWAVLLVGGPCAAVLWFSGSILRGFGQDPVLAEVAQSYLRAMVWGLPASHVFVVLRCFVSVLGRPSPAMAAMLLSVLLNVLLDWLLIFGHLGAPALGLVGAGLASSAVNTVMCGGLLVVVLTRDPFRRHFVLARFWRPDWGRLRAVFALGLPTALAMLAETGLFSAAVMMMGWLGTLQVAAHAIAVQCAALTFMVPLGVSNAGTIRVGMAAGAGDRPGVRRAGYAALALGLSFMSLAGLLFALFPQTLVGAFLDLDEPGSAAVLALGVVFLGYAAAFQLFDGGQVIGLQILRGLGDSRMPMVIALFGYWCIGAPCAWVLAFHFQWGGRGIWVGLAAGLATVALLAVLRFSRRERLGLLGG